MGGWIDNIMARDRTDNCSSRWGEAIDKNKQRLGIAYIQDRALSSKEQVQQTRCHHQVKQKDPYRKSPEL